MNRAEWIATIVSALLTVPLGIVAGLLVPFIQRSYRERGETRKEAKFHRLRDEAIEALMYRERPQEFTHFLIRIVLQAILAVFFWITGAAVFGLLLGTEIFDQQKGIKQTPFDHYFVRAYGILALVVTTVSYAFLFVLKRRETETWHRVKHFDQYAATLPKEIRELIQKHSGS